jgi:hypothetical protein
MFYLVDETFIKIFLLLCMAKHNKTIQGSGPSIE